jgi:hypothetical protein
MNVCEDNHLEKQVLQIWKELQQGNNQVDYIRHADK